MTSKIVSLVSLAKLLYTRGALGKTATIPGSWTVGRRVVGTSETEQEEKDGEDVDVGIFDENGTLRIVNGEEEDVFEDPPITSAYAKIELERFSKQYFRGLLSTTTTTIVSRAESTSVEDIIEQASVQSSPTVTSFANFNDSQQIIDHPDLRVPVGDEFLHLAQ